MFTGIITDIGHLIEASKGDYEIACHYAPETIALGASIACNGCCLTVTKVTQKTAGSCHFHVTVSPETAELTTVQSWKQGDKINLERALKLGDEFGGHIVTGHIDGKAKISAKTEKGNSTEFKIIAPKACAPYIAAKGSIALDGVSLTVNQVKDLEQVKDNEKAEGTEFSVMIIPHTLEHTCWQYKTEGDELNIEVDLLARYVLRGDKFNESIFNESNNG